MDVAWKNVILNAHDNVRDALKVLDSEGLRVVLVVEESNKLIGVLTDGDIRRGLLAGLALDDRISEVMNTSPLAAQIGSSREELVDLMRANQLLAIPLLQGKQLVGLETLVRYDVKEKIENPVFIMAGGFGERLKPLTNECPKPLLKVGGKPLLEILLNSLIRSGFSRFYISTHYLPKMISDYFGDGSDRNVSIEYVHEDDPLGTGGALGLLNEDLPSLPMLVVNGDVLTSINFKKILMFHDQHSCEATMCVREYEYQVPYGVVKGDGQKIISMDEKPIQRCFVNAGIYIVNPDVRKSVVKNVRIDMPSVLQNTLNGGAKVMMFPMHEYWLDIGSQRDYEKAQNDVLNLDLL